MITIFLIVLIVALVLGNLFLMLLKPKSKEQNSLPATQTNLGAFQPAPKSSFKPGNHKPNAVDKRVDRIENLLLKINGSEFLGKKLDSTVLGKKLNDLTRFKTNTKVEIEALKEQMAQVKNEIGIKEKTNPCQDYDISDEKLHELVFKSANGRN